MVGQLLILLLVLLLIPFVIGGLITEAEGHDGKLLFRWVSGQFLLWAGFQLLCVPLILRERSFGSLVAAFWGYIAALLLLAATWAGVPMSTSHTKTCAVLGAGAASGAPVDGRVLGGMILAWAATFPACGAAGWLFARLAA